MSLERINFKYYAKRGIYISIVPNFEEHAEVTWEGIIQTLNDVEEGEKQSVGCFHDRDICKTELFEEAERIYQELNPPF